MDGERLKLVTQIFEDAAGMPRALRQHFIADICADDPELERAVLDLLERHTSFAPTGATPPRDGAEGAAASIEGPARRRDEHVASPTPPTPHRPAKTLPTAVAATLLVLATALALASSLAITQNRALRQAEQHRDAEAEQRRLAVEAQRRAAADADTAQAINAFLIDNLLAAAPPPQHAGGDVTMRDLLDAASAILLAAEAPQCPLRARPLARAAVHLALARSYESLAEFPRANPHLERALEIRRAELGEAHAETLDAAHRLAALYAKQGRDDLAEPLLLTTLATERKTLGADHPKTLETSSSLAILYRRLGRFDEAEPCLLEAYEILLPTLGADHPRTLQTVSLLAELYEAWCEAAPAEGLMDKAEQWRAKLPAQRTPDAHGRALDPHTGT